MNKQGLGDRQWCDTQMTLRWECGGDLLPSTNGTARQILKIFAKKESAATGPPEIYLLQLYGVASVPILKMIAAGEKPGKLDDFQSWRNRS